MPNEVLKKVGTQIRFRNSGEFSPTAAKTDLTVGTPTDVDLDLAGGGGIANGAAQESAKFDFGATRAAEYSCMAAIESGGSAPTSGESIDFYLAPSPEATATDGNPGQIDGADAVAPTGDSTLAELLDQCLFIGSLLCNADANTIMIGWVGRFSPPERYGILIVVNNCGQTLAVDAVESHVVFNPIVDEIQ